jgi:ArsR family transcriptional regulator
MVSILALLYRAGPGSGLDPWLIEMRRSLPDSTRYDLDVLEGFSGRLLYYLEEPVNRFGPLDPENRDAPFADLLDFLTDLSSEDYREIAIGSVCRVRAEQGMDTTVPLPGPGDDPATRDLMWRRFLEPALTTATADDVIPLLDQPELLRLRTINLFRVVWTSSYRDLYLANVDLLQEAADRATSILHEGFGRSFSELTGSRVPATLASRLHDITEVVFHPSIHLGDFISFILSPPRAIVFFDARRFLGRSRSLPRLATDPGPRATSPGPHLVPDQGISLPHSAGVSTVTAPPEAGPGIGPFDDETELLRDADLIDVTKALGDLTRLRILELLVERERYAQELVTELGVAQSAVSRHLSQLERAGLVSVRPQRGMKYYSVSRTAVARLLASLQRRLMADQ